MRLAGLRPSGDTGQAMSQRNVEIVRSISAPWKRGDFSSAEWAHPEIEWEIADGPAPSRRTGLQGMLEGWREFLSAWEDWRVEAEDYRALDGEWVLVLFHFSARGKASAFEMPAAWTKGAGLYRLREGKVVKLVLYWDRERALQAVERRDSPV